MSSSSSSSTELCLACSGSPLSGSRQIQPNPKFSKLIAESESESKSKSESEVFRTSCCARPICASCLRENPRLARYAPCLACLGGVRAVAGPGSSRDLNGQSQIRSRSRGWRDEEKFKGNVKGRADENENFNMDGALRDGDVFAIGDEDEDEDEDGERSASPPPAYRESVEHVPEPGPGPAPALEPTSGPGEIINAPTSSASASPEPLFNRATPGKHYIRKEDTLRGLALRYGVDGRALCRLNNLPPSTLSTTPHLLHTRAVLVLPPSASAEKNNAKRHDQSRDRDREIELERTAKRLQLITKEADWRVARAYAVLAQSSSSSGSGSGTGIGSSPLSSLLRAGADTDEKDEKSRIADDGEGGADATAQERALDAYLEDDAWEARERTAGRGPSSSGASFPP